MNLDKQNQLAKHLIPVEENPEPIAFAKEQESIFWTADEINVEKDIQDMLVNLTPSEKHGVITTLKLFSLYETHAGDEYWGGRFKTMFDGSEFRRMASVFSMFELNVHAPFYKKINDLLHLNTPEFYLDYLNDPTLNARMNHIGSIIDHPNDLVSLAGFSMVEGVILYSNFAYLKHFSSQGKNKITNITRGIDFSVRDENIHSMAGAWCFKHKAKKLGISPEGMETIYESIKELANQLLEHEIIIIRKVFEKGTIDGITEQQLISFVKHRIDLCLQNLGFKPIYHVTNDLISSWFYKGINSYQFSDFFQGIGREYNRNWDATGFTW